MRTCSMECLLAGFAGGGVGSEGFDHLRKRGRGTSSDLAVVRLAANEHDMIEIVRNHSADGEDQSAGTFLGAFFGANVGDTRQLSDRLCAVSDKAVSSSISFSLAPFTRPVSSRVPRQLDDLDHFEALA